ncbi:hypothetical protein D3C76_1506470 [compost metagenome]
MQNDVGHGNPLKDIQAWFQQQADVGQVILFVQQAREERGGGMAGNRSTGAMRFCRFQGVAQNIFRFADAALVDQAHAVDTTADQGSAR